MFKQSSLGEQKVYKSMNFAHDRATLDVVLQLFAFKHQAQIFSRVFLRL